MLEGFVKGIPLTFNLEGNEEELCLPFLRIWLIVFHVEEMFLLLLIFFLKKHRFRSFFLMS